MRRLRALLPLLILLGCDRQLHRLFEAPPPPYIRLSLSIDPAAASLSRGGELTITATVTRTGEDRGPVSVSVTGLPAGVAATTRSSTTVGDVTTATLSIRAATDAAIGNYSLTVNAHANQATDAASLLVLTVIEPPDFTVATNKTTLTIARGGIARVGIALARTNVLAPISLSATSDSGIAVRITANPLAGDTTTATIAVDPGVATGKHTMIIHASSAGLAERTATLAVDVIDDPLQLLVDGDVSTPQLSAVSKEVIVNGAAASSTVSLTVEGLPPNVQAAFDPLAGTNSATLLRLGIGGTSPAGTYTITVRARSGGVPDATATLTLRILPAGIALSVAPAAFTSFTGSTASTALSISRSNFAGSVVLSSDPLPSGVTVTFDSAAIAGSEAKATIAVSATATAGTYTVTFHAAPVGLSADAARSASLALTVLVSAAGGNVALDWSGCTAPDWVAIQSGTGPWTRLGASQGIFVGAVSASIGAIAYVEHGSSIIVRYMTAAELTEHSMEMCGPPAGARSVTGSAAFGSVNEIGAYSLGGGSGRSTAAQPNFTIGGVRDGVHDLVAYSYFQNGAPSRFAIRRDVAVNAATTNIAPIDFQGAESFAAVVMAPAPTISGPVAAGETYTHTLSYLTSAACDTSLLYTSPGFSFSSGGQVNFPLSTLALPDSVRRTSDYYLLTVFLTGNGSFRSSSIAFHAPGAHALQLAPLVPTTTVSAVPGAYERLKASFGSIPEAYNRAAALTYDDGSRTMTVSASRSYADSAAGILTMPDLSLVSGWPSAAAIPSGATGSWRLTLEGSTSPGSACSENRVTYSSGRTGQY